MNKLIKTQYFTPKEFESLSPKFVENMLHNEVPFIVSINIQLEEGFSWVVATSKLLKQDNNGYISTIDLTKIETKFLKLLIENKNSIVTYEIAKNSIWKTKDMSIFTMRNFVNKIRNKTYKSIIKNKSGYGYIIEI
ncbi:MAG: helix-turn-helix domain-containing protein [Aliarcobacter sp.]|nr:helix-turn-helix domain-containing protein [Aliarcobacter sp.]